MSMRRATNRTGAGVLAAIGTAAAGALLALFTGLGQGIGGTGDSVTTTSTVVTAPTVPAAG